jgi:hypothetical protein
MTVYQWVCVLGIPGMLAGLVTFIKLQVYQNRAMKLAVQAILRDRLLQSFQFCKRQGFATSDDRQNFENMYVQLVLGDVNWVAALSAGGFGFITAVLLALTGLPEASQE